MNFKLLISNPSHLLHRDENDTTVSEALQTIYPYTKESSVYMYWNGYILELWFCAEISDIFKDILQMVDSLKNKKAISISWGSNIFFGTWDCSYCKQDVKIKATWTALRGGYETLKQLNMVSNELIIDIDLFLKEWLKLLMQIKEDLKKMGYSKNNLEDFYLLESLDLFV